MSDNDALLVAYVDGELDPDSVREVEKLLAEDPRAQQAVEIYRETSGLLRAACGDHVYAGHAERLLPAPACVLRRAPRRYGWAIGVAMAACVAGFIGGANWVGRPTSEGSAFAAEVADYHAVFAQDQKHLVEVQADRLAEITTWLGRRLERPFTVPDLTGEGLQFAGARLLAVNGRPVAQLMYTRAGGPPVALCVGKLAGAAAPIRQEQFGTQRTALWSDGSYAYIVVGELDEAALQAVARDAARQLPNV